jgi:Zn-dependent peptidase ImmA (M78 family)
MQTTINPNHRDVRPDQPSIQRGNKAAHRAPSLLTELREATPIRSLGLSEAKRVAELQANKLRAHLGLDETAMPNEMVANQPHIRIVFDEALDGKASGTSLWNGDLWIITLNPLEPLARQRFSLFHEYKHIIDHRFLVFLYLDETNITAGRKAELVADYFAACVLMPKLLVKRHYCGGVTELKELAELFDVSEQAMEIRLDALGLRTAQPNRHVVAATSNNDRQSGRHASSERGTKNLRRAFTPKPKYAFKCTRGLNKQQALEYLRSSTGSSVGSVV